MTGPKGIFRVLHKLQKRQLVLWGGLGFAILVFMTLSLLVGSLVALMGLLFLGGLGWLSWVIALRVHLTRLQRRARILTEEARAQDTPKTFTAWAQWPVEPSTREAVESARASYSGEEILLAHIDADGRVQVWFGDLPGFTSVNEDDFVETYRFQSDIVLVDDKVLVRKDYRGDRRAFTREWYTLGFLYGNVNVPAVYKADIERCILYKNLIPGRALNHVLVEAGARILLAQTREDPELAGLNPAERIETVWARGRNVFSSCFSREFVDEIERQLDKIHACGVTGASLTFGNIIVDAWEGKPWFIDLEGAQAYRSTRSPAFAFRRNQDREKFKQIYGRHISTQAYR